MPILFFMIFAPFCGFIKLKVKEDQLRRVRNVHLPLLLLIVITTDLPGRLGLILRASQLVNFL